MVTVEHQLMTHVGGTRKQQFVCWNGIKSKSLVKVQSLIIYQLETCSCVKLGSQGSNALIDELTALMGINRKLVEKYFLEIITIMFETFECTNSFEIVYNDSLQQCLT